MDEVVNQCMQAEFNAVLSFLLLRCALQPVIVAGKELRGVFSSLCLWAFVCATHGYGHTHVLDHDDVHCVLPHPGVRLKEVILKQCLVFKGLNTRAFT